VSSYWAATRAPRYSLIFALPLFLLYEGLAASLGGAPGTATVRNAADVALKTPFFLLSGARGSLAFFATVIAVCVFLVGRDLARTRDRLRPRTFLLMLGESAVLAVLLGVVVGTLTQRLLGVLTALAAQSGNATPLASLPLRVRLMLALGAGLYEELLFRVMLVGGMAAGLGWLLGRRTWLTGAIAAVVGALIFSAFHYVGEYGDRFELASFTYRTIAGLAFSGLYLTRGFGITAWTHALYDVYVMVL
jgi:membrane protease YdiL (CAAX protease family)